ncbi:MutS 4 [Portunus trituberculatus]|uniref:MutS 4 n=1 Tax=Portunus trituberculatus TaxID=210409 RepID=A0A5B7K082_PORTR|nr:MutS 4 [Portunus trituberculatus]
MDGLRDIQRDHHTSPQIGSFVPAEMASLRPVKKVFTHLSSEDHPEGNESTFQVQVSRGRPSFHH